MLILLAACRSDDTPKDPADPVPDDGSAPTGTVGTPPAGAPTWWRDVQPVVGSRCATCHRAGDIAPFPLETYDEAVPWADAMAAATEAGTMPPWQPSADCAPLEGDRTLPPETIALFADWAAAGAPEGDPADAIDVPVPVAFTGDLEVDTPDAYTPPPGADDYRCFVVDWPLAEATFVTAYEVVPEARDLVHHVILYLADAGDAAAADADDTGPGYECFGSSGLLATTLGAWVPGVGGGVSLPEGTGVEVRPDQALVVQVHYNTLVTEPRPDRTAVSFALADAVDAPASPILYVDPLWLMGGMRVPAGEVTTLTSSVSEGLLELLTTGIGGSSADPLRLHRVSSHMHTLGASTSLTLLRDDGSEECLLDIPDWDFHWQGGYNLVDAVTVEPGDRIELSCTWDNTAPGAVDVNWGENTGDEMCLAGFYVTR